MSNLTVEDAVKVHEWADRCVVKIESYWCDEQRAQIEYEVTHHVELERFGVEHHSLESLCKEALEILAANEQVMERVEQYLISKGERWLYDEVHPHLDSYLRFDDQSWPLSPLQELRPSGLIERAISLGMKVEQMMGVEG